MRFTQYKGVIDLIDSVIEATEYMKVHNSGELCDICAQSLHSVLNTIENESNSSALFRMINDALNSFETDNYDSDNLLDLLKSIKEKSTLDLKYKLRILFVAELGGKWDSMASVYQAFSERDDCDVDVVLEPIFREVQYSDGSTKREVIYNDWLTPLGINHIPYNCYDMISIRPDITFFSQPYESCTIPMFWPENMAKYTRVVYLPYYAAVIINKDSVEYESFFLLNTQKHSWKIACQSDAMKALYKKHASREGENVVVSGLPKWDYAININSSKVCVPKEWDNKLQGKKVFLWNTHFSIGLSGSQLFTDKMDEFLNLFEEKQNEIALIWRPHPMLETIIEMYYSQDVYDCYWALKKRITDSSNMLIDNQESYELSFVCADAIISDYSSLMDQFMLMHKPALMLTNDLPKARFDFAQNELFDYSKIEFADTLEKQKLFIEEICNNKEDKYVVKQDNVIKQYFKLADGKCGKRLADLLVKDFVSEAVDI